MSATIDQQFVEYVVKALVSQPDKVKINRTIDERGVLLELTVDAEDLGRVIGRNGSTAKSIRTLLRALGVKNDARYNLKIVDVNHDVSDSKRIEEPEKVQAVEEEPAAEPVEVSEAAVAAETEDAKEEDRLSKTRKELADLTDLDI